MTIEEAINTLGNFKRYISGGGVASRTDTEAINMAIEALKEEPRKTAKWLPYEYGSELWHKCSNCGKPTQYQHYYKAFDGEEHLMRTEIQNYCRYCGAKMGE